MCRNAKKRHVAWAAEAKTRMHIMTANVCTLEGQLPSVLADASEAEIHVICLQETRHNAMTALTIKQQAVVGG